MINLKLLEDEPLPMAMETEIIRGLDGKDGAKGEKGEDGYTPKKGIDYFDGKDGYTPIKGVDYFDGQDGRDGKDGLNGKDGINGTNGRDGVDGKDGKDYVINESDYEAIAEITKDKVDLDDYVKSTDWANSSRGGVFITSGSYGITVSANGYLQATIKNANQYDSMSANGIIGKGTLENVLADKGYITAEDVQVKTIDFDDLTEETILNCYDNNIVLFVNRDGWLCRFTGMSATKDIAYFQALSTNINRAFTYTVSTKKFTNLNQYSFAQGTIPTKTSQLTNDSGYITNADVDTYQVGGYMTGVPSGSWKITCYKNGVICEEELYCDVHYSSSQKGVPTSASSNSGSFTGTKTASYNTAYKYLIDIYTDSTKSKFLCSTLLSYGSANDEHILELIDQKLTEVENADY